jgi:hypothetical protein
MTLFSSSFCLSDMPLKGCPILWFRGKPTEPGPGALESNLNNPEQIPLNTSTIASASASFDSGINDNDLAGQGVSEEDISVNLQVRTGV